MFKFTMIALLVALALATRIGMAAIYMPIANFTPLGAMALFCGAKLNKPSHAFLSILMVVWLGDLVVNQLYYGTWVWFYPGCYWQYAAYVLIAGLGFKFAKQIKFLPLMGLSLASSTLFFIISNFGVWFSGFLYPRTLEGMLECYVAAIPFFQYTLLGDLFFSILLFSAFRIAHASFASFAARVPT